MDIDNFNDALHTYKYLLLIVKNLHKESIFESMIKIYRETILSSIDTITLDILLMQYCSEEQSPKNNIDIYGVLAIEHYLKFININKYPDDKYKQFGKILLKAVKILTNTTYELPEWVWIK